MNILVIPYNYPTIETQQRAVFVADQVQALREKGHEVDVLGAIPKTLKDIVSAKSLRFGRLSPEAWLISVPAIRGLNAVNRFIRMGIGKILLKRYLVQKRKHNQLPDIIHVHNSSAADLALWCKDKFGIAYVITEHSSLLWGAKALSSSVLSSKVTCFHASQANIAVSENFAAHLSDAFSVKFHYVPNVVDTEFFKPKENLMKQFGAALKLPSEKNVKLVSVGNLTKNKNHQLAIYAVKSIKDRYANVTLQIAGDGPEKHSLQELIKELGLESHVTLLGKLNREKIRSLLQCSDFFLLPSKKETFGVVLIEAMATGLPVLALKNGGSESIVNPSVGMLVSSEESFKNTLLEFLTYPFDSFKISEFAIENFSASKIVSELMHLYNHKEY